jgi:hypothetical protein
MSNAIAIRSAVTLAIASYAVDGCKHIATVEPVAAVVAGLPLTLERSNKDKTKTVVRDVPGLMLSGNPSERARAGAYLMAHAIVHGEWAVLASNVGREFPAVFKAVASVCGMDAATGKVAKDGAFSNRSAWDAVFVNVAKQHAEKPFKGAKLNLFAALQCGRATFAFIQGEADADKAEKLASGTMPGVFDGESRIVADMPALSAPVSAEVSADEKSAVVGDADAAGEVDSAPVAALSDATEADDNGFAALMAEAGLLDAADTLENAPADADSVTA